MLIVEGPDGSGKSTLVKRLCHDLDLPLAEKVVSSDTKPKVDLAEWTEDNIDRGFQFTVFDRHRLISEPIYGPILRDKQDPSFMDLGWLDNKVWRFYACKPILIYCLPPLDIVVRNISNPDTDNSAVSERRVIEALYASYVNRASLDLSRGVARLFNYEVNLYSDVLRWAQFKLEEARDRLRRPADLICSHTARPARGDVRFSASVDGQVSPHRG